MQAQPNTPFLNFDIATQSLALECVGKSDPPPFSFRSIFIT
jgi:hypothetical protein